MKGMGLTGLVARKYLKSTDPEEMMGLVDTYLPMIMDSLPKEKLKTFLRLLFQNHLPTLLRDLDQKERAALLQDLVPIIAREMPLREVVLEATADNQTTS